MAKLTDTQLIVLSKAQPPCRLASSALSLPPPAGSKAIAVIDRPFPPSGFHRASAAKTHAVGIT